MTGNALIMYSWDRDFPMTPGAPTLDDLAEQEMRRCDVEGHLFTLCPSCGAGSCVRCGSPA